MRRSLTLPLCFGGLLFGPLATAAAMAPPVFVVVVSVEPQAALVERLLPAAHPGEPAPRVVVLVPPGGDVETFAPTPSLRSDLDQARLVFSVGHPGVLIERAFLSRWLREHPATAHLSLATLLPQGGANGANGTGSDPHLWTSVRQMRIAAGALEERLLALLPDRALEIEARGRKLDQELAALDEELTDRFERRAGGRVFLVGHATLGSFAADYGLRQIALDDHGHEPTAGRVRTAMDLARAARVRAILVPRGAPDRGALAVASALKLPALAFDPFARDWFSSIREIADLVDRGMPQ